MKICWAPLATSDAAHGYGTISRELFAAIALAGGEFTAGFDWDVMALITTPLAWPLGREGLRPDVCWHTMFDMDTLPGGWTQVLNRAGSVWTPSRWCADLFRREGITAPLFTVGYGVDHNVYHLPVQRSPHSGPFKVLAWGSSLAGRKNINLAIRTFMHAALPDAVLEVKVNAGQSQPFIRWRDTTPDNVIVHAADWQRDEVADWLRSGDVLLYLSGGEGYGLMPLEAMACGLPVICHACTGMLDYLTAENCLSVPSNGRVECPAYSIRYDTPLFMAAPDVDAAVEQLRWAYHNRRELQAIGVRGHQTAGDYTWLRSGRAALAQLEQHHAIA